MTHSLSHSAKSVFKFDQNFFMSQAYRSCYAFDVPHLKCDLRKRENGFLRKKLPTESCQEALLRTKPVSEVCLKWTF